MSLKKHIKSMIVKWLSSHFVANGLTLSSYMNQMKIQNSITVLFVASGEKKKMEFSQKFIKGMSGLLKEMVDWKC